MHTFLEIAKWTKKFHPDKYFAKTREIGSIATNCFVRASAYGKSSRPAKMLLLSLLFILFFSSLNAQAAATYYVRAGASGTQNGSEWNDAYSSLPSNLIRGATYYIADGSYSGYIFDDSGTTPITIKKATIADHGTNTGWSDTMGDGQATFGTLDIRVSGIILDGNTRNESNWANESSYGFKINTEIRTSTFDTGGFCPDNVTIKYSSIGGSPSSKADDAIYLGGFHVLNGLFPIIICMMFRTIPLFRP